MCCGLGGILETEGGMYLMRPFGTSGRWGLLAFDKMACIKTLCKYTTLFKKESMISDEHR